MTDFVALLIFVVAYAALVAGMLAALAAAAVVIFIVAAIACNVILPVHRRG